MLGLTGQRFLSISTQLAPLGTTLDHMSTRQRYLGEPVTLSPQGTPPSATAKLGMLPQTLPKLTSSEPPPQAHPRHLSMKTRKGMRMGKPSLRMRMVSRMPEYRSWLLTTSASKSPGSWGTRG